MLLAKTLNFLSPGQTEKGRGSDLPCLMPNYPRAGLAIPPPTLGGSVAEVGLCTL